MSDLFVKVCKAKGLPAPQTEWKFDETRKWRFDYAWPRFKVALEVEGAIWTRGRHTRGSGFVKDMEKYSEAAIAGWCVIRCAPAQLLTAETLDMIRRAIDARRAA